MNVPLPFRSQLSWDDLTTLFPMLPAPGRWLPLLRAHARLVALAAPRVRVTAVSPEDAVRRQYAESLELIAIALPHIGEGPAADVGSGGGYPGIVMAAVLPEIEVHLVEPLQKRARLLEEMAAALLLENVRVHPLRAEEAGRGDLRGACTVVTARAVAGLRELVEYTAPLACEGGAVLLPKGSRLAEELAAAGHALAELGCIVEACVPMRPAVAPNLAVAVLRKTRPTPAAYPRRPGVPGKYPL